MGIHMTQIITGGDFYPPTSLLPGFKTIRALYAGDSSQKLIERKFFSDESPAYASLTWVHFAGTRRLRNYFVTLREESIPANDSSLMTLTWVYFEGINSGGDSFPDEPPPGIQGNSGIVSGRLVEETDRMEALLRRVSRLCIFDLGSLRGDSSARK